MAQSDYEPTEADVHSDPQAMSADDRDPAEVLLELEALESLLKDRFDGSTAFKLQKAPAAFPAPQHLEAVGDRTNYTAFPLFPVRPAPQSETLAPSSSSTRKRKRQDSEVVNEDGHLDEQAVAERLRKERKREKKRNRHDKKLMPLVRAESPEPEYPGPGRGRIVDVDDEDPAVVALRRRQIRSIVVSGSSVLSRRLADKWTHPHASRVTTRRVLASQLSKESPFPSLAHATARNPAKGKKGGIPPVPTREDDKFASRKLRLIAYPRQDVPRLEVRVQKQREERKRLLAAGQAGAVANVATAPAAVPGMKAIKSNRPVLRVGRKKEVDLADEVRLHLFLAKTLGVTATAPGIEPTMDGHPPKKKKKLGKKERERAKAAKAASELKEGEVRTALTDGVQTEHPLVKAGTTAEQDGGRAGKRKRESKKRRMYERLGMGTPKEKRLDRKEKTARRRKAKMLLKEITARQLAEPLKATEAAHMSAHRR